MLILDEPTSSLDDGEVESLFAVLRRLRATGHRDPVRHPLPRPGLRDRRPHHRAAQRRASSANDNGSRSCRRSALVASRWSDAEIGDRPRAPSAGRGAAPQRAGRPAVLSRRAASARRGRAARSTWSCSPARSRPAGLLGSGAPSWRACCSARPADQGSAGDWTAKPAAFASPPEAMRHGLGFCPEDRKTRASSASSRCARTSRWRCRRRGVVGSLSARPEQDAIAERYIETARHQGPRRRHARSRRCPAATSRRRCSRAGSPPSPRVLILDEPTRGIDVAAKQEIMNEILALRQYGHGVVFFSAEMRGSGVAASTVVVICATAPRPASCAARRRRGRRVPADRRGAMRKAGRRPCDSRG